MDQTPSVTPTANPPEWAILEAMAANGENISVRSLQRKMGSGSFTRLAPILKAWRATKTVPTPPVPTSVDNRLNHIASSLWDDALQAAREQVKADLLALQATNAQLKGTIESLEETISTAQETLRLQEDLIAAERQAKEGQETTMSALREALAAARLDQAAWQEQATRESTQVRLVTADLTKTRDYLQQSQTLADHLKLRLHQLEIESATVRTQLEAELGNVRRTLGQVQADLHHSRQLESLLEKAAAEKESQLQKSHAALTASQVEADRLARELQAAQALQQSLLQGIPGAMTALQTRLDHLPAALEQVLHHVRAIPAEIAAQAKLATVDKAPTPPEAPTAGTPPG